MSTDSFAAAAGVSLAGEARRTAADQWVNLIVAVVLAVVIALDDPAASSSP